MNNSQKQKLLYDPLKEEVVITPGFNGESKSVMPTNDFLNLCFQMGWEGTRYKIETMRMNFEEVLWNIFNSEEEINSGRE